MGRLKFSWDNLPAPLLRDVRRRGFDEEADLAGALRRTYGAQPSTEFIRDYWPVLLDSWLRRDRDARTTVVHDLRTARLGDVSIPLSTVGGQMDYLRSCRNGSTLREVVRTALIDSGTAPAVSTAPTSQPATPRSRAWQAFTAALAAALGALEEDSYLIVARKDRNWFVQFAAGGAHGMRAEMVSNAFLPADGQVPQGALDRARELGWTPPTGEPGEATPTLDPDGSPNWFRGWEAPVPFLEVAHLAVDTLVDVLATPSPSRLQYAAFTDSGDRVLLPTLGLKLMPTDGEEEAPAASGGPLAPGELRDRLLALLRRASGDDELVPDDDGDIPVVFGSAVVFVRVLGDPPLVRVFSPVLSEVTVSDELIAAVNTLNTEYLYTKWIATDDAVIAGVDLLASPLVEKHVLDACGIVGDLANHVDEDLQQRFGGRTFLGENPEPKPLPPTGGYL